MNSYLDRFNKYNERLNPSTSSTNTQTIIDIPPKPVFRAPISDMEEIYKNSFAIDLLLLFPGGVIGSMIDRLLNNDFNFQELNSSIFWFCIFASLFIIGIILYKNWRIKRKIEELKNRT